MYEKGQNYTVTCKSNNPDILADNGRISSIPRNTQTVSYTVTVKDNYSTWTIYWIKQKALTKVGAFKINAKNN